VVQKGIEYNTEFMSCPGVEKEGFLESRHSFMKNNNDSIIISAVKKAENSSSTIVRAYEAYGNAAKDFIEGTGMKHVSEVNLLEEGEAELSEISFKPFEIKTLKFEA
jgi:alpha-mannosidase